MNLPRIAHPFVFVLVLSLAATGLWAAAAEEEPAAAMEKRWCSTPEPARWWRRHDMAAH